MQQQTEPKQTYEIPAPDYNGEWEVPKNFKDNLTTRKSKPPGHDIIGLYYDVKTSGDFNKKASTLITLIAEQWDRTSRKPLFQIHIYSPTMNQPTFPAMTTWQDLLLSSHTDHTPKQEMFLRTLGKGVIHNYRTTDNAAMAMAADAIHHYATRQVDHIAIMSRENEAANTIFQKIAEIQKYQGVIQFTQFIIDRPIHPPTWDGVPESHKVYMIETILKIPKSLEIIDRTLREAAMLQNQPTPEPTEQP